jgi:hypothetical protein
VTGVVLAAGCLAGGYALSRWLDGSTWTFMSAILLVFVVLYFGVAAVPRRLAPSHTQRSRDPVENAGLHQMAYHIAENPGDGSRARHRFNPDLLITACPPLLTLLVLLVMAGM